MSASAPHRRVTSLGLVLFSLLLFAVQPLLDAHPSAMFAPEHRDGVHGPDGAMLKGFPVLPACLAPQGAARQARHVAPARVARAPAG